MGLMKLGIVSTAHINRLVIPGAHADKVVERTEAVMHTESELRRAVRNGQDPQKAYLQYGKF